MSRLPAEPSPIQGGEVCRHGKALYWLTFEPALPGACRGCPFGAPVEGTAAALCQIRAEPRVVTEGKPTCQRRDWQRRARLELAALFRRLMPTDAELAEIAAELGGAPTYLPRPRSSSGEAPG